MLPGTKAGQRSAKDWVRGQCSLPAFYDLPEGDPPHPTNFLRTHWPQYLWGGSLRTQRRQRANGHLSPRFVHMAFLGRRRITLDRDKRRPKKRWNPSAEGPRPSLPLALSLAVCITQLLRTRTFIRLERGSCWIPMRSHRPQSFGALAFLDGIGVVVTPAGAPRKSVLTKDHPKHTPWVSK